MLLKELLVSSRRFRTYLLRLGYLMALLLYAMLVANAAMGNAAARFSVNDNSAAAGAQVMADAGTRIAAAILWFQFVASQVLMLVSMSTAVTGEHRARTLEVLLATPLDRFQIVLGKLLAGLLRVGTLLLCSLPLLMLVRVLGGVPADTLIACLVTTLLAAASWAPSRSFGPFNITGGSA